MKKARDTALVFATVAVAFVVVGLTSEQHQVTWFAVAAIFAAVSFFTYSRRT